jgi:hypothetical protein
MTSRVSNCHVMSISYYASGILLGINNTTCYLVEFPNIIVWPLRSWAVRNSPRKGTCHEA